MDRTDLDCPAGADARLWVMTAPPGGSTIRSARCSRRQPRRRRAPPAPARPDTVIYVVCAQNIPIAHAHCLTDALRGPVSKLAYAWEKLRELPLCEKKRLYLIASGVDIYRTQIARELRPISFGDLRPIHIVTDHAGTNAKMQARAQKLRGFAGSLPPGQKVTPADIDRLMPSVTPFRAVEDEDGAFILFEGVGRHRAIREALGEVAALDISVEVFRTKDPARTLRLVHDVQRANGLRPGLPRPLLDLIGPANSSNPGFLAQVWELGLVRTFVKDPALAVVRDTVSSTLRSAYRAAIQVPSREMFRLFKWKRRSLRPTSRR